MSKPVSRSDSEKGRAIWDGVARAGNSSPDWAKKKVKQAAKASALRIAARVRERSGPAG